MCTFFVNWLTLRCLEEEERENTLCLSTAFVRDNVLVALSSWFSPLIPQILHVFRGNGDWLLFASLLWCFWDNIQKEYSVPGVKEGWRVPCFPEIKIFKTMVLYMWMITYCYWDTFVGEKPSLVIGSFLKSHGSCTWSQVIFSHCRFKLPPHRMPWRLSSCFYPASACSPVPQTCAFFPK